MFELRGLFAHNYRSHSTVLHIFLFSLLASIIIRFEATRNIWIGMLPIIQNSIANRKYGDGYEPWMDRRRASKRAISSEFHTMHHYRINVGMLLSHSRLRYYSRFHFSGGKLHAINNSSGNFLRTFFESIYLCNSLSNFLSEFQTATRHKACENCFENRKIKEVFSFSTGHDDQWQSFSTCGVDSFRVSQLRIEIKLKLMLQWVGSLNKI